MSGRPLSLILVGALSLGSASARANQAPPADPAAPSLPDPGGAQEDGLAEQLEELRQRLARTEDQLRTKSESPLSINGYVDFGFFMPRGNDGVGWVSDPGGSQVPEFKGYSWSFLGDMFATMINSRGDVADLGNEKAPGMINRFDSVNSDGAPGFLVNEMNLRLGYQLADSALLRTSVNFVPRTAREDFAFGDYFDLDLAEMEWMPTDDGNLSVFFGKTLPVFGIEYKERKADQRFGITPSLMQRYTSGPQLGAKVRWKTLQEWLVLAAAVTNNSSTTEQFQFYREVDRNSDKTLSGRVAVSIPLGDFIGLLSGDRLELGASYLRGAQDRSTVNAPKIEFMGADLQYLGANFALKAQLMQGTAEDTEAVALDRVWALDLKLSGYLELDWLFLPWLGATVRAEQRDAVVTLAMERAYITKQYRVTGGVRVVFNPRIVLKAEYIHNREYGGIDQFDDDIFTSSLVLSF